MTSVIIMGLLSGALFIYGLPSLVRGAAGKTHNTPIGDASMVNIVWGVVCWGVAVLLWHTAPMAAHPRATFVAVIVGVLVWGWAMSAGLLKAKAVRRARKTA